MNKVTVLVLLKALHKVSRGCNMKELFNHTLYNSQPHTSFSIFFMYALQNYLPLQKDTL